MDDRLRSLRRRYGVLLVLRFVPTGLSTVVLVLLLQDRGLTLGQLGLAAASQGLVMLVLELPSGGLADALGRKPVLLLAAAFNLASVSLLLSARSVAVAAVAFALQGVFRALDSGPLEAWFIDASLAADPGFEVERGLARADVTIGIAIGLGALAASGLVALDGVAGLDPLATPLVVGMGVQLMGVAALVTLVDEHRGGRGWSAVRASTAAVPAVVAEAVRLIRGHRMLAALVGAELLWGFGMVAFERLLPPRLDELAGGADAAASLLGVAVSLAWAVSAVGAATAPRLVRRVGSGPAGAGLRLAHGTTVAAMALATRSLPLLVAYLATYAIHGASAPVHYGMVHRAVPGSHRATVVSANSLASQVGFGAGGIALGTLADAASTTTAMGVAAAALAAAAPLYLVDRPDRPGHVDRAPAG